MSVKVHRILKFTFDMEKDCYKITKKIALCPSFMLGDICDELVDYSTLGREGYGEFTVKAGTILDFIESSASIDPDIKAALLEDVKGKSRDDDVRYECM